MVKHSSEEYEVFSLTICSWGAKVRGIKTGIAFNNLYNLFDTPRTMDNDPYTANHIGPGRRGRSAVGANILVNQDGKPIIAVGGSGGGRIRSSSGQVSTLIYNSSNYISTDFQNRVKLETIPKSLIMSL